MFPPDFMWGVSSSAFQIEGGNIDANWNRYNDTNTSQDRYGNAVDFRHRYSQDIALAHDLGANTYRISIDWARVEPKRGQYDAPELAYYDDVIATMKRSGITPLISLEHWAYPGWVLDQGGWVNANTISEYLAFVKMVVTRYHADIRYWLTFNEAAFYLITEEGARVLDPISLLQMDANLIAAHRQAYDLIHQIDPGAMVSSNIAWAGKAVGTGGPVQITTDLLFLDAIADKVDFIGFDYYYAGFSPLDLVYAAEEQPWNAALWPYGIYAALQQLGARYPGLPLLVVENGMPTDNGLPRSDGYTREEVLRDTVYWVQRARADGMNVIGYLYWSLTDTFEWGAYSPRFGLYTVDVLKDPTLTRKPTAAAAAYRQITEQNGMDPAYTPVLGGDCSQTPLSLNCIAPGL